MSTGLQQVNIPTEQMEQLAAKIEVLGNKLAYFLSPSQSFDSFQILNDLKPALLSLLKLIDDGLTDTSRIGSILESTIEFLTFLRTENSYKTLIEDPEVNELLTKITRELELPEVEL
jgi:hypothetical protein